MDTNIRVAKVSSVNYDTGMIRVVYTDKGKSVSTEMPYANQNSEYFMPEVGEEVQVNLLSNGTTKGVVLGTYWNKKNLPAESGKGIYRKELSKTNDVAYIRYADDTGNILIKGPNAQINGSGEVKIDAPAVEVESRDAISFSAPIVNVDGGGTDSQIVNVNVGETEINASITAIKSQIKELETEISKLFKVEAEKIELTSKEALKVEANELSVTAEGEIEVNAENIWYNVGGETVYFNEIIEQIRELGGNI